MQELTKRQRFKFSLRALLLVTAAIALLLAAYIIGYQRGYDRAQRESRSDYVIFKQPGK